MAKPVEAESTRLSLSKLRRMQASRGSALIFDPPLPSSKSVSEAHGMSKKICPCTVLMMHACTLPTKIVLNYDGCARNRYRVVNVYV